MSALGLIETAGVTAVQHIVGKMIMPALARLAESVRKDFELNVEPLGKHFGQYLERMYEKNSILNTLVFHNQQKLLRDLYIPLTLELDGVDSGKARESVKIESYPREFMSKYRRVLITDTAGMGKSTLTKIMFLSAIDQEAGIPFYIELRRLSVNHSVLDELRDQLNSLTKDFDDSLMRAFFQAGGFIFFFDGFDEIGLADRKPVTEDLKRFIEKAPDNYYILTSRYEQALTGFGDFRSMRICPLKRREAYSLLRKYDSDGETSRRLIEKLDSGDYEKIREFLRNPLLVSLLFIGFEYKPEIPLKIHLFYDQVFEAYFNNHDLSKDGYYTHEKLSGLDMADFANVLRAIGYICLTMHRMEFDRNDFMDILEKAKKLSCVPMTSTDALMNDLLHAVPLFCLNGVNYKWVHKSMQEYFAADFINRDCGEKKVAILKKILESEEINNYMNLLEFYADLDIKNFQQLFVLPLLDAFISYVETPVHISDPKMKKRVLRRRQVLFGRDMYLYLFTKAESRMPISEAFAYLRRLVDARNMHCTISRSGEIVRGLVYVPDKNERLAELVIRKYPRISVPFMSNPVEVPTHIEYGKMYHYTEDLMAENPEAFDELDAVAHFVSHRSLNYERAKDTRESIRQTLRENEDVFNDLFEI